MPCQASWLPRVKHILEDLDKPESRSLPFLTRASIESLFDLKRRQAIKVMHSIGTYQIGKAFVIDRAKLIHWLRRASIGEKVWYEEVRRTRVEESIEAVQWDREARKPRAIVPCKTLQLKLPGIPPTVTLQPGEMRIQFFGADDLFRQLFELAQAMRNDYERFRALVDE
ncbi:MAG: hypothetical protein ACRD2G_05840 [Terriglobia bacterium]